VFAIAETTVSESELKDLISGSELEEKVIRNLISRK
jgi:hypothetical protein